MKRFFALFVVIVLSIVSVNVFAAATNATQTVTISIPELEIMRINPNAITLLVSVPLVAGDLPVGDTDNTSYVQWTCLNGGAARSIGVGLSANAPAGTTLDLAITKVGAFSGTIGGPHTTMTSAGGPYSIATAVANGNTGSGATGMRLDYTLNVTDASLLVVGDTPITMTFTLTDSI